MIAQVLRLLPGVGDMNRVPGSCLWPDPALAIHGLW